MEEATPEDSQRKEDKAEFKKPVLFGRIGKLPKRAKADNEKASEKNSEKTNKKSENIEAKESNSKNSLPPAVLLKELSTPIPYKEPKWSGLCPDGSDYGLEVLKSGMIVENIDLTKKPYFVFGRLANCDVVMAHPTISRYHAVLQYKAFAEEGEPTSGWYLYDMESTHGTFLNKERLKANHYTRVRVGHQIKFGTSTRTYIVLGPDFDSEGETELSVTEIKKRAEQMKQERDRMVKEAMEQRQRDRLEEERRREEQGIDWGMGEDAEEEPDLAENPFAVTTNEELYLEDPKKTLRGYFEREGHELSYDCEERGVGQFICSVELPMDDARGKPVVAEVIHRGKKKEAVIACALEACRILDRAGLLRQSKHESRRRKQRDWSADDYYDSDEDTFLDRTGSVERKRTQRMRRHGAGAGAAGANSDAPLTHDDLLKKVSEIENNIALEEKSLERLRATGGAARAGGGGGEGDALDEFMRSLGNQGTSMSRKADISRCKMTIQKLKMDLSKAQRLAEVARPAHLPPLLKKDDKRPPVRVAANSVVYGKRIRLKEDVEKRPKVRQEAKQDEGEFVEEVDSDEESTKVSKESKIETEDTLSNNKSEGDKKRLFGPMRPPENYVVPENYFDQETDRDLPEIMENE